MATKGSGDGERKASVDIDLERRLLNGREITLRGNEIGFPVSLMGVSHIIDSQGAFSMDGRVYAREDQKNISHKDVKCKIKSSGSPLFGEDYPEEIKISTGRSYLKVKEPDKPTEQDYEKGLQRLEQAIESARGEGYKQGYKEAAKDYQRKIEPIKRGLSSATGLPPETPIKDILSEINRLLKQEVRGSGNRDSYSTEEKAVEASPANSKYPPGEPSGKDEGAADLYSAAAYTLARMFNDCGDQDALVDRTDNIAMYAEATKPEDHSLPEKDFIIIRDLFRSVKRGDVGDEGMAIVFFEDEVKHIIRERGIESPEKREEILSECKGAYENYTPKKS